ncbi:hypothetical protein Q8A73_011363 [Channa argus]|nr:hypothetical protein Q8A73_011363 [Channa argus]
MRAGVDPKKHVESSGASCATRPWGAETPCPFLILQHRVCSGTLDRKNELHELKPFAAHPRVHVGCAEGVVSKNLTQCDVVIQSTAEHQSCFLVQTGIQFSCLMSLITNTRPTRLTFIKCLLLSSF